MMQKHIPLALALVVITVAVDAQQPPQAPPGQGRGGRGGGMRGAEPLAADDQRGFESIFDGKTLNGWDGDPAFWSVANGAIVG